MKTKILFTITLAIALVAGSAAYATDYRAEGFYNPDSDSDGVIDRDDWCPDEGGLVGSDGCPIRFRLPHVDLVDLSGLSRDSDGDGIVDIIDRCRLEPAPGTEDGCPIVEDHGACVGADCAADEGDGDVLADEVTPETKDIPTLDAPGDFHVIDGGFLRRPAAEDAISSSNDTSNLGFENMAGGGACSLIENAPASLGNVFSLIVLAASLVPLAITRKKRS